jgi:hypothetical protein
MPKKEDLIDKLCSKPIPKNFTTRDLDLLMKKCNCTKFSGGRGSGVGYVHNSPAKETLQFDGPHPGNELYSYQVKKVISFLERIGEI